MNEENPDTQIEIIKNLSSLFKVFSQEVYKIDEAMTRLDKITNVSSEKYSEFLLSAKTNAQELGLSLSSLINQTSQWADLGVGIDTASELAKISTIYSQVQDVSPTEAISNLFSIMKAFDIEAENSITIVDKLCKLNNEFSSSSGALGEALVNSASAMALGGNSLEKTLALLTGGAETTKDISELAATLQIGQFRVLGMTDALINLGAEIDENVTSISKMQSHVLKLTNGKVSLFDDNNNLRAYYDILEDVSDVYNNLSAADSSTLLETLFGRQSGAQGETILQAFQSGQIQKALDTALTAEGSALQEQELFLSSLEAKTEQFEAAFQSLSSTILDSELLKGVLDFGTGALNIFDSIIEKVGALPTLIAGISAVLSTDNIGKCA